MFGGDDSRTRLPATISEIEWKKELLLVCIGGIIGGLVFTSVSPFIVPHIHNFQVNHLGAGNPVLGVEVEYAGEVPGNSFSVSKNDTYDRYNVIITNPSTKELRTVTVGVAFPGGIEAQSVGHFQTIDEDSYSQNANLVQTKNITNGSYVTNAIFISQLPPEKTASAAFLIDTTPEETLLPGYWETTGLEDYNASKGSIMVSGQYRWEFKGSVYIEEREFTYINVSSRASPHQFDICVGAQPDETCS